MELTVMKCPNCAGEIPYTPGNTQCRCPYCDSMVHITKTVEEAEFEQNNIELAQAKEKYFKQLKKWNTLKYVCMALAVVSGVMMAMVDKDSKMFLPASLPAMFFTFAAGGVIHAFAPEVPESLKSKLNKKELPTSTGKLYGIFIGLMFLGFLLVPTDKKEGSADSSTASSAQVKDEAEAGGE